MYQQDVRKHAKRGRILQKNDRKNNTKEVRMLNVESVGIQETASMSLLKAAEGVK